MGNLRGEKRQMFFFFPFWLLLSLCIRWYDYDCIFSHVGRRSCLFFLIFFLPPFRREFDDLSSRHTSACFQLVTRIRQQHSPRLLPCCTRRNIEVAEPLLKEWTAVPHTRKKERKKKWTQDGRFAHQRTTTKTKWVDTKCYPQRKTTE